MKSIVLICGTRTFEHGLLLPYYLMPALPYAHDIMIVQGGALGADLQAKLFAQYYGIPCKQFDADWSLGRKAGPLRNREMARWCKAQKAPVEVHAFWDGVSRGTADMIIVGKEFDFIVRIHRYLPMDFYFKELLLSCQDEWKVKFKKQ